MTKKSVTRKKLVDLKAVAALLDDGDPSASFSKNDLGNSRQPTFSPNEDLIQATSRIKTQRDLVKLRVRKMEEGKGRVSRSVFEKVNRDYGMQLENISNLLNEKKGLLLKELKKLYMLREKQSVEINRHKEILEEAHFRHYLEEFSEEQYKEVEEYESREISSLQSELSQIHSYIKVHEELFDPEDLGLPPRSAAEPEKTKTLYQPPKSARPETGRTSSPPPASPVVAPAPRMETSPPPAPKHHIPRETPDVFSELTPLPGEPLDLNADHETDAEIAAPAPDFQTEPGTETHARDELVLSPEDQGYFETAEEAPPSSAKEAQTKPVEPESIFDVLEDFGDEGELSSTQSRLSSVGSAVTPAPVSKTPAPQTAQAVAAPAPSGGSGYKLVFKETEGPLDIKEMTLRDNISIGRSPSNDLVLQAPKVSRQHAAINKYKDQFIVIDLKSSNGVFVNGRKVDEQPLKDGDEITIGATRMVFVKA